MPPVRPGQRSGRAGARSPLSWGEPGVGKSRLAFELTHSHRVQGWLVLESGSVSYGKATSYLLSWSRTSSASHSERWATPA